MGRAHKLRLKEAAGHGFFHSLQQEERKEAKQIAINLRVDELARCWEDRLKMLTRVFHFMQFRKIDGVKLLIKTFHLLFPSLRPHTHEHTHAYFKKKNFDTCRVTECFGDETLSWTGPDCF